MRITKSQLKQIIAEELNEMGTFHKGGLDWDTLDQETSNTISRVMESFIARLRRIDNKEARSIMKSMRELIMSALTKMLATDSDPGQESF
jgi:hypothetical protein